MTSADWRPLFFTGGTALRALARELSARHISSVHIVSTFDSGGSSAQIRKSFAIPAFGDLRNRLLALADSEKVNPAVLNLLASRLPGGVKAEEARKLLERLPVRDPVWQQMDQITATALRHTLFAFLDRMPDTFDARGASIGNLMLAGSFLENGRDFRPALAFFSSLLHIRGVILPVSGANLHLGAYLHNGRTMVGQHLFHDPPDIIDDIFLTVEIGNNSGEAQPCRPLPFPGVIEEIMRADLVCLPMGSFFSSLLPNLLPGKIGAAIASCRAPKVYIPNSGLDRELRGVDLLAQVAHINRHILADSPKDAFRPLNYILVDKSHGKYQVTDWDLTGEQLSEQGIRLIDGPIVDPANVQRHMPSRLLAMLEDLTRQARRQ